MAILFLLERWSSLFRKSKIKVPNFLEKHKNYSLRSFFSIFRNHSFFENRKQRRTTQAMMKTIKLLNLTFETGKLAPHVLKLSFFCFYEGNQFKFAQSSENLLLISATAEFDDNPETPSDLCHFYPEIFVNIRSKFTNICCYWRYCNNYPQV